MQNKILQVVNILIVLVNSIIFIIPKKPVSHMQTNAAGLMVLVAVVVVLIHITHIVLLAIAMYYRKQTLLIALSIFLIPLSLLYWLFVFPMLVE